MNKKSQISLFIIIGIVILALVLILYSPSENNLDIDSDIDVNSMNAYVEECMVDGLYDGLEEVGYNDILLLENEFSNYMYDCVSVLPSSGYSVVVGDVNSNLKLTNDNKSINVKIYYSINVSSGDSYVELTGNSISINLFRKIDLPNSGRVLSNTVLTSPDHNANLLIPAGTVATLNGQPVAELSITIDDNSEYKGDFASRVMYNLRPDGVQFSSPVILEIGYDDSRLVDIPGVFDPEDYLALGTFDSNFDPKLVKTVYSSVDKDKNLVTANIKHFSNWVITSTVANQNFQWKHYLDSPEGGITYRGRYNSVRWPSAFYNNYDMRESGTKSLAGTLEMTYYQLDKSDHGGSNRLSYTQGSTTPYQLGGPMDVLFCKDGKTFAKKSGVVATEEETLDIHSLTCLSEECGGPAATACVGVAPQNTGGCSSPQNCDAWDYASNAPCPTGYVNCDGENHCGHQGTCATCSNSCP